ncbi:MAG: DUF5683 domain-containing protein [Bacteroidales bacterium]|jgi:hypothetical protein|nr:DUF5683 domain-containing protein [Bacteroidales bacterium]
MEKRHSPTKATIMSACLPGLGQIYNKKAWKVPIIYAGFGVFSYFIYTYTDEYINYKCAYIESVNGNMNGNYSDLVKKYSKDELLSSREFNRRNLEINILFAALWYALNILDATVDAHLYTFNISDKLTLRVEPSVQPTGFSLKPTTGIRISIHF